MCGIAGALGPKRVSERAALRSLGLMAQRGPDAAGQYRAAIGSNEICLLHTRLAIIDLTSDANQPFRKHGCAVVFNGELYNYRELREELEARGGHRFQTQSDTEVLLEAYLAWGEDCVDRFEGMWAFALHDEARGALILSRDRFGEKPLFYRVVAGVLFFASEIKTLEALAEEPLEPDLEQVSRYLANGYKSLYKAPRSFFRSVAEFPAAHTAVITEPARIAPRRYWHLSYQPRRMSADDALEGTRARLRRAVELRLRADVPVAFCLSSGVDSTVLAGLAARELNQPIATFTIFDTDPRYDEREGASAVAEFLGCRSTMIHAGHGSFFQRMAQLVAYHDAPVATISYYVHSFLSEAIAQAGYKVAISGTGADEVFTGYYDHYGMWLATMRDSAEFPQLVQDWRDGYGRAVRNPLLADPLAFVRNPELRDHIYDDSEALRRLMVRAKDEPFAETAYAEDLLRNRMMNELFHECVPVILKEDDLNSMMFSVENRSPYLDRALVEFLYTVPNEHLIRDGFAKWLLRRSAVGCVPDVVLFDKRKRGFNASIDTLIDRRDPETVERLLAPGLIFDIVRRDAIERLVRSDLTENSLSKFMFSFVSARLFLESDLVSPKHLASAAS